MLAQGKGEKITTNAQMLGLGGMDILDTYLSAEKYKGSELRYISHTTREWTDRKISHEIIHQGNVAFGCNRADNADEMAGSYRISYGISYNWKLMDGQLNVKAGGMAEAGAGFCYNMRNGNNPAQAQLAIDLAPSAGVAYRLKAWGHTMFISYDAIVPILGAMFSPNYGQSYFEIFNRGNYDKNIVATTIFNAPSLRQTLSVDFYFKSTALRLGCLNDIRQAKVNNLKYHQYSNMLVIGFVKRFKLIKTAP